MVVFSCPVSAIVDNNSFRVLENTVSLCTCVRSYCLFQNSSVIEQYYVWGMMSCLGYDVMFRV